MSGLGKPCNEQNTPVLAATAAAPETLFASCQHADTKALSRREAYEVRHYPPEVIAVSEVLVDPEAQVNGSLPVHFQFSREEPCGAACCAAVGAEPAAPGETPRRRMRRTQTSSMHSQAT